MSYPILYSLQNCPYAIRARLGLFLAKQPFRLRAVDLKNIPAEMLTASAKGTVPVLVSEDSNNPSNPVQVIDESLDIMLWALRNNDPQNLLYAGKPGAIKDILSLVASNDTDFIPNLENYKYSKRHHDFAQLHYRDQCTMFVADLERRLASHPFSIGDRASLADYAILPFIRQFARVDRQWYLNAPYPKLRGWLNMHLQQPLFTKVMAKYPPWANQHEEFLLAQK